MTTLSRVSRNDTYAGHTDLEVEVCTCGVLFAVWTLLLVGCLSFWAAVGWLVWRLA